MTLIISPDGRARAVYSESIDLALLGSMDISRVSYVEPDAECRWHADLAPVSGPILGPFARRGEALAAEVAWLEEHWLPRHG